MNGKSIVKNYFIAWWAFQKSIWPLFENVVKWDFGVIFIEWQKLFAAKVNISETN